MSSDLQNISLGQQFAHLLSVWTLGINVILTDEELNLHLQALFEALVHVAIQKTDPTKGLALDCVGVPHLVDLVQSVLTQYLGGETYGSSIIGQWLWVFFQQGLPFDLRLMVWSSLHDVWHVLALVQPPLPIGVYLYPYETHSEILQLYIHCLASPQLGHPLLNLRQTPLYQIMIHHLSHFFFHSSHSLWARQQMFCNFLNAACHPHNTVLFCLSSGILFVC